MISRLKTSHGLLAFAVVLSLCGSGPATAEVRLPALFTDHMVLQQGQSVPVWGWADEGEAVTVEFRGQKISTTAKHAKWMVKLAPLKADSPGDSSAADLHTLRVSGKNTITLSDVLVGEVWIASGQSNMEWPLNRSFESQNDIANAANPNLRLFTVPKLKADKPVDDVKASWQECNPQTVPGFSAVAYYFARNLQKSRNVPVGIIHTSWGGSPAEVWISERVLAANPAYKRDILDTFAAQAKRTGEAVAQYEKERAAAEREGKPFTRRRPGSSWKPAELYNGMIAPLIPYAIKGAIWYQGESNAGRAHQYRTLFADMIKNWRSDWRQGRFTFLEVQLAPWDKGKKRQFEEIMAAPGESDWAELREAQVLATRKLPKVGMAVITDVGDRDDIHPTKKEPVGARLALSARRIAYGEKIVHSGPTYRSMNVRGDRIVLSFDHVGRGLDGRDVPELPAGLLAGAGRPGWVYDADTGDLRKPLVGFAIAGADRKFVWATARIRGNEVVVSSPAVPKPVAVRYGWADYPVVNLWNKNGLPASPFRTDDFPMITAPKQ